MSPTAIAVVSVVAIVVLMVAIKIVVGKLLHDQDSRKVDASQTKRLEDKN